MSRRDLIERRDFLKRCLCTAVGSASFSATMTHWNTALAALATDGTAFSEFRALVCVFLSGGNDSFNMVVPNSSTEYNEYAASRQNMAVAQGSLLPITPATPQGGASFGFHPSCGALRDLFNQGRLGVVANVGVLTEPTTRQQYLDRSVSLPPQLFSHNNQTTHWMTSRPDSNLKSGWAGRTADLLQGAAGVNTSALLPMNISLSGTATLQTGATSLPFNMTRGGVPVLRGMRTTNTRENRRRQAFEALLNQSYSQPFMAEFARIQRSAMANADTINSAVSALTPFTTTFPTTRIGRDLEAVAEMIAVRSTLSMNRQIYFVRAGGWDTHGDQLNRHPTLLGELNDALLAFWNVLVEMGVQDNVTTFTNSEFGRTLTSNGDGTDHAWGGHSLVLGGSVNGGDIYGTMPSLALGGPDDSRTNGRLIPTQSVDQYAATLARWFGVSDAQLSTVFPNLGRFASNNLGFML
jgi:uncharacterized protein (DUF1501 family)